MCIVCSACADNSKRSAGIAHPSVDADAGAANVHVRFDLGQGSAMMFGSIPWPDDLYLDKSSRVDLAAFPESGADAEYARALLDSLSNLDGFGVSSPVYFFLDGDIDKTTLPLTAADSTAANASAYLIDADTGSPVAFQRVRVTLQWFPSAHRLALRPAPGHPLVPGRRYAALVTRRVKDLNGQPVGASATFLKVRDSAMMLSDARLMQASAEYTPVLQTLIAGGASREDIVGMAVFRVQTTNPDLSDARAIVRSGKPPIASNLTFIAERDLDATFGTASAGNPLVAAHDQLVGVVQGTLSSPSFVSATAKTHGAWERDDAGQLRVKRTDDVPFTLFVPRSADNAAPPIVFYQHQLGHERSDAVFVANALAANNIAVLAIDAPFQGLRAKPTDVSLGVDTRNRFTGAAVPDGFGDVPGDFFGITETSGGLTPLHPFYARDAMRQGVVDLMSAVRLIEEGDLSAISSKFSGRKFGGPRSGFIGEDVGAEMGTMLASFEPNLQALVLIGAGSGIAQDWSLAAAQQPSFGALARRLGRDPNNIDYVDDAPAFWPGLALFDTLAGRGEPLAYTSSLRRISVNVLLQMVTNDEAVSNQLTEALSAALAATFVSGTPRYVDDLASGTVAPGQVVGANFAVEDDSVTRVLQSYDPADHALLLSDTATQTYEQPPDPPFNLLARPNKFTNPTSAALAQIASYFDSYFACVAAINLSSSATACEAATTSATY